MGAGRACYSRWSRLSARPRNRTTGRRWSNGTSPRPQSGQYFRAALASPLRVPPMGAEQHTKRDRSSAARLAPVGLGAGIRRESFNSLNPRVCRKRRRRVNGYGLQHEPTTQSIHANHRGAIARISPRSTVRYPHPNLAGQSAIILLTLKPQHCYRERTIEHFTLLQPTASPLRWPNMVAQVCRFPIQGTIWEIARPSSGRERHT